MGVSEQTYHRWKKQYAEMGVSELRRLKQLEDENASLCKLVADLSLDKHILQEIVTKSSEARTQGGLVKKVADVFCISFCRGVRAFAT